MAELARFGRLMQRRAHYLGLVYRVRQNLVGIDIMARGILNAADKLGVQKGTVAEYNRSSMRAYQELCRQFARGTALRVHLD